MDGESLQRLMQSVTKNLPQDAANALDTPITLDELRCAVWKACGADGISQTFFKNTWKQ
jgi:hypothetical protein